MALATALWVIYYKNSWLAQQPLARKWGTTGCEGRRGPPTVPRLGVLPRPRPSERSVISKRIKKKKERIRSTRPTLIHHLIIFLGVRFIFLSFDLIDSSTQVLHFPDSKRAGTQLWSNFLVFALIAALCVEIDALEYLEAEVLGSQLGQWVVNAIVGVQIPLFSAMFLGAAKALTEAENYQTETAFLDALALKCCYFEFFNHYGALFYQGFVKQHTYGC